MEGARSQLFGWYSTDSSTTTYFVYFSTLAFPIEVRTGICSATQNILHLYPRLKSARVTDWRVRVMNEIISGMRLIKMYAWEWAFHEYVKNIRKLASTE